VGRHPEEFFSITGGIVTLAATLEQQVLVFYQYLSGAIRTHTPTGRYPSSSDLRTRS